MKTSLVIKKAGLSSLQLLCEIIGGTGGFIGICFLISLFRPHFNGEIPIGTRVLIMIPLLLLGIAGAILWGRIQKRLKELN